MGTDHRSLRKVLPQMAFLVQREHSEPLAETTLGNKHTVALINNVNEPEMNALFPLASLTFSVGLFLSEEFTCFNSHFAYY